VKSPTSKPDLTFLVLAVLVLQTVLLAGLLVRTNQVYRWVAKDGATAPMTEISLVDHVSADDDPSTGPPTAPVTIVEFSDFSCGHCREAQETLEQVKKRYGDRVQIVFRDFPLEGEVSGSFMAALAAECADDQNAFWEMHDLLFEKQPAFDKGSLRSYAVSLGLDGEQFQNCLESKDHQDEILHDREEGVSYGVSGTPTFFVNGRRLIGTVAFSIFERAIDEALQER